MVAVPSAPVQVTKMPPLPPSAREESQIKESSDQFKESGEEWSSESSESLSSDSDHQEEARDSFDTSKSTVFSSRYYIQRMTQKKIILIWEGV